MDEIVRKLDSDGRLFAELDRTKRRGKYIIRPASNQHQFCREVELIGFDSIPSGLYKQRGNGLTGSGYYLLEAFSKFFKKPLIIRISARGRSTVAKVGNFVRITIRHEHLLELNKIARFFKQEKNQKIRAEVRSFLVREWPTHFRGRLRQSKRYTAGALDYLLHFKDLFSGLSSGDKDAINRFIPSYLSKSKISLRDDKKLRFVLESIEAGRTVYLRKVIGEFEKKLASSSISESQWQHFLSRHILILRTMYGEVLEKENISLEGKYPDFMLIDPYSYLDVYEIKKPQTRLLSFDKSRNNYYWDRELAKAISQVENYIHQLQKNSDSLIVQVKKSKGLEVSIVKPRGYIIAGCREQLKNAKMTDDFRILNDSLKNVDVLLYDDLLINLKSFVNRLSGSSKIK